MWETQRVSTDALLTAATGRLVSRETMRKLETFRELFEKWAARVNLIAPSTKGALWERHIADSAQLVRLLPRPAQWIDLGSGGGFPGIVTAILLEELGGGHVVMVESNHKKAAFLRSALVATGAPGSVLSCRIEDAALRIPSCEAISARALADVEKLVEYSEPWFRSNTQTRCFFHKGRDYSRELDKARDRWQFDLVIHSSVIEADSVILEISGLSRKD